MSLHGGEGNQSSTRRPNILANIDHISQKLAAKTANFSGAHAIGKIAKAILDPLERAPAHARLRFKLKWRFAVPRRFVPPSRLTRRS